MDITVKRLMELVCKKYYVEVYLDKKQGIPTCEIINKYNLGHRSKLSYILTKCELLEKKISEILKSKGVE